MLGGRRALRDWRGEKYGELELVSTEADMSWGRPALARPGTRWGRQ